MTNTLVGDVYARVIDAVIRDSANDFEESGVSNTTLEDLGKEWRVKLSQRGVAQMPWDPKPEPTPSAQSKPSAINGNGLPPSSYANYDASATNNTSSTPRIKSEPGTETQYSGLSNGFPQQGAMPQGGGARAQHLMQQQFGQAANASISAMQQRGGLALPGQQQQAKPQGLHLPAQSPPQGQQQYSQQQQQQQAMRQQQYQQQQSQARIKVENDSPQLSQGSFTQQPAMPTYSQTDGADEDGLAQWKTMLEQRRAMGAEQIEQNDRTMRNLVLQHSADLQSGLMVPLDEQPSKKLSKRRIPTATANSTSIPQLDGDVDPDEERADGQDEDDENAINSDLDDSDDDGKGPMGDEDDDNIDQILCTYDKVQRVKNKWKCTLKDGIMSANGKEWVFHKGTGEFEW